MPKKAANPRRRQPQKVTYTAAYRRRLVWRIAGFIIMGIGVVMTLVHIVVHLGRLQFLPTTGLQDLLTGYPMAGLLFIAGVLLVSRRHRTS
ncbi:LPXTG cell wall anchor domain-containing protein [Prauserella muralis]|uniref:Uncharacterized protein n=1 Tax=Prauserella muralis TaxID=588067 RepID=A0A2V4B1U4_9PSEU|nr:LPXTG cell wall anchor domain-containing protein [Prauserella muralis]PXY28250.1 hypothetical protein BAY60_18175 [Prauserella muralis]TWE27416.1 LPXTG-motif cell wall-anchored protein [Prauserella muralis]